MAKLVFGMNQSLDGYVDHLRIAPPSPTLFRHFIEEAPFGMIVVPHFGCFRHAAAKACLSASHSG